MSVEFPDNKMCPSNTAR